MARAVQPMSRIAESVLVLATYVAGATGARKVDDEHLLAALAEHPLGGARRVLRRVSDLDALPVAEERALARAVAWSAPEVPRLRRSRRLDGVVRDAGVHAAPPGCSSVDLLVQLATSHTDSGDALRTAGATPDRIGAAVEQLRHGLDETETWRPPGSPVDGVPGQADVDAAISDAVAVTREGRLLTAKARFAAMAESPLVEDEEIQLVLRAWLSNVRVMHEGPGGASDVVACRRAIEQRAAASPSTTLRTAAALLDYPDYAAATNSGDIAASRAAIARLRQVDGERFQAVVDGFAAIVEHAAGAPDVEVDQLLARASATTRARILTGRDDEAGAVAALDDARREGQASEVTCRCIEAQLPALAADRRATVLADIERIDVECAAHDVAMFHLVAAVNARILGLDDAERHARDALTVARRHGLGGQEVVCQLELGRALLRRDDRLGARAAAEDGLALAQRLGQGRMIGELRVLLEAIGP